MNDNANNVQTNPTPEVPVRNTEPVNKPVTDGKTYSQDSEVTGSDARDADGNRR